MRGIRVDRPRTLDFGRPTATPEWTQQSMFGAMPVRDVLVVIGNELLEATMSFRSRWFEYLAHRPLIGAWFRADPDMRREAAPEPRLNVLVLDPGTVCVEASETAQMEQLDRLGFEVVPVPFWDVAPFGGGLHCATLDVHREGVLEDCFPRRSGRF
ncbi:hypothetical protein LKL35_00185 [Streptomyces sp. ET3-23]|uniref:hypothetical protein n=1 Tax=Streptomyces sp. ET3-23 TaxID=2885643 RepID=UPI001D12B594|nr:hypothetical protein [Streptomyces sp. ET3-23]MCC2273871.1 hypothetical protein [Streptomyces sp. ET3-23]